ncbi:MAG TPA: pyridoxamine 5'-phosphate oxidase family protein [Aquihabitans sp.]|jgi:predicted pyridoxine 5'-phosphate oxidase superfamily flavin-nucleotide-binding protein|nr:pyridoxamine 5'-phosphate oxidase family protein [Aquihabitans sp.]
MGRSYDAIPDHLAEWMPAQPVFFVATAPLGGEGHVNVSPKGDDTFRVIDPSTVAYLDLTGSGAETIAHVRENGRLTIMFCSFGDKPNIVRLYGRGEVVLPDHPDFAGLVARFEPKVGTRSAIRLHVERVTSSCGYVVPRMELVEPRHTLDDWSQKKGPDGLAEYRAEKNATSIDGLPALAD